MSARPSTDSSRPFRTSVGIEGPCCAGKTTLSRGLIADLARMTISHVQCFADHVGGGRFLPRAIPETVEEDRDALEVLLNVEADRTLQAKADRSDLVLIDRSVYTLLAHRSALERVTSLRCLTTAQAAVAESDAPLWPDLVIYLDVPQDVVHERNRGKFTADSIFIDANFNAGVRAFFADLAEHGQQDVLWLDATLEPAKLITMAGTRIQELLGDI